jgi:hypothetical protein
VSDSTPSPPEEADIPLLRAERYWINLFTNAAAHLNVAQPHVLQGISPRDVTAVIRACAAFVAGDLAYDRVPEEGTRSDETGWTLFLG